MSVGRQPRLVPGGSPPCRICSCYLLPPPSGRRPPCSSPALCHHWSLGRWALAGLWPGTCPCAGGRHTKPPLLEQWGFGVWFEAFGFSDLILMHLGQIKGWQGCSHHVPLTPPDTSEEALVPSAPLARLPSPWRTGGSRAGGWGRPQGAGGGAGVGVVPQFPRGAARSPGHQGAARPRAPRPQRSRPPISRPPGPAGSQMCPLPARVLSAPLCSLLLGTFV